MVQAAIPAGAAEPDETAARALLAERGEIVARAVTAAKDDIVAAAQDGTEVAGQDEIVAPAVIVAQDDIAAAAQGETEAEAPGDIAAGARDATAVAEQACFRCLDATAAGRSDGSQDELLEQAAARRCRVGRHPRED